MSRSYKHTPRCGETKHSWAKKQANRSFRRRHFDIRMSPSEYKRHFCTWDICDYEWVGTSFESYYRSMVRAWHLYSYRVEPFPDKKETLKEYKKFYIWK